MFAWMMGLETISPDALHRSLPDGRVHVFDLNSPQSWAKARVPGAKRLEPESWSADELPAAKDAVMLRQWDDLAKQADWRTPTLSHFLDVASRCALPRPAAA